MLASVRRKGRIWVLGFSLVKRIDSWIDMVKVRDVKARSLSDIVLN